MIKNLHIENYVLIDNLDLDLENGLNIITGETGAGKSILLGAISMALGERSDAGVIRKGAANCIIEVEFSLAGVPQKVTETLSDNDIDFDDSMIVRRLISSSKSRSFINDIPVTQSLLRELAPMLVDIHSQHQALLIGDESFQTGVVDSIAGTARELQDYSDIYRQREETARNIENLVKQRDAARQEEDYIRFQYEQLSDAKLVAGEEEQLASELDILSNASLIGETLSEITYSLNEKEGSVIAVLQDGISKLNKITGFMAGNEDMADRLSSVQIELKEIYRDLDSFREHVNEDPERRNEVEQRIDLLNTLMQKHHKQSTEELITLRDELDAKLGAISNFDDMLDELRKKEDMLTDKALKLAGKISEKRLKSVPKIEKSIISTLKELGIPHAKFKVSVIDTGKLLPDGKDEVYFSFSANQETDTEKIDKVASGGEISRLMLALKVLITEHRKMPTMVFDEIDTGVSGHVADKMGEIMVSLAGNQQIINITHLPQVASKGSHHYFVYKKNDDGKTRTDIIKLDDEQRVKQIAVMLSGRDVTEAAIAQARELLGRKSR